MRATGTVSLNGEPFDLKATLESGQTFQWRRWPDDGEMFDDRTDARYYTVLPAYESPSGEPEVFRVEETTDGLAWDSTLDYGDWAASLIGERLGLTVPFDNIRATFPDDELLEEALDAHAGLRVPRDPAFPTLISFICSAAMQVERIHEMQRKLADAHGETVAVDGYEFHAFPSPEVLASVSEDALRDLKLGYRAEYVNQTAEMVATDDVTLAATAEKDYEDARNHLTQFVGVGDKVADCTLLFGFGFLDVVPIDTWVQNALDEYYPDLDTGSYATTSQAFRDHFGPFAGYAQAYLFHHLRTR